MMYVLFLIVGFLSFNLCVAGGGGEEVLGSPPVDASLQQRATLLSTFRVQHQEDWAALTKGRLESRIEVDFGLDDYSRPHVQLPAHDALLNIPEMPSVHTIVFKGRGSAMLLNGMGLCEAFLSRFPNVTGLVFGDTYMGEREYEIVDRYIRAHLHHQLQYFHLGANAFVGDKRKVADGFLGLVSYLSVLRELFLEGCDGNWEAKVSGLSPYLERVYVTNSRFDSDKLIYILKLLDQSHHISELSFEGNEIDSKGIKVLTEAFERMPRLQVLNLKGNKLGDTSAMQLAASLKDLPHLYLLDLRDNKIGDEGAVALAHAFPEHMQLKEVELSEERLGKQAKVEVSVANMRLTRNQGMTRTLAELMRQIESMSWQQQQGASQAVPYYAPVGMPTIQPAMPSNRQQQPPPSPQPQGEITPFQTLIGAVLRNTKMMYTAQTGESLDIETPDLSAADAVLGSLQEQMKGLSTIASKLENSQALMVKDIVSRILGSSQMSQFFQGSQEGFLESMRGEVFGLLKDFGEKVFDRLIEGNDETHQKLDEMASMLSDNQLILKRSEQKIDDLSTAQAQEAAEAEKRRQEKKDEQARRAEMMKKIALRPL